MEKARIDKSKIKNLKNESVSFLGTNMSIVTGDTAKTVSPVIISTKISGQQDAKIVDSQYGKDQRSRIEKV